MLQIDLTAVVITDENLSWFSRYSQSLIIPDTEVPAEFKVGAIIVFQTFRTYDLFDRDTTVTTENEWLTTREEFEKRFEAIGYPNENGIFEVRLK